MINLTKLKIFYKKYQQQILAILLVLIVITVVYGNWFGFDIIARGDWKARSDNWIKDWLNIPFAWDTGDFGGVSFLNAGRLARYPLYFLQAFSNQIFNLPYSVTERLIWFFPFLIISALAIYYLTKEIFKEKIAGYLAIFIILFNNFVLFRAHGAQIGLLMGTALTPLAILFFIKALKARFWQNILLASSILAILSYNDTRLFVLTSGVIFLYGFYIIFIKKFISKDYYQKTTNKQIISALILIFTFLTILNAFWILPTLLSEQDIALAGENFFSIDKVESLSRNNFWDTLALSMGDNKNFGKFVYLPGQINKNLLFLLPLLVFLSLFLSKNKKEVIFWFTIFILFAFFAKGMNPPLAFLNKIFYENIPLASMFRLPDKFIYILATPFAMLYGVACAEIIKRKNIFKKQFKLKNHYQFNRTLLIALFIFLPLSVIFPAVLSQNKLADTPGGSSFKSSIPEQYYEIDNWLNSQPVHYKTLWTNGTPRYVFFNFSHPRFEIRTAAQNNSLFGNYYLNFVNFENANPFLKDINYLADIDNFDKILGLANIKYLMLAPEDDPDWEWEPEERQLTSYLDFLAENNNLNLQKINLNENKKINIFVNNQVLPKINPAQKSILILGGGQALEYLLNQPDLNINDWNFYFIENFTDNFQEIKNYFSTLLFYNQQNIDDLILNTIENQYKINQHISYNKFHKKLASQGQLRTNYKTTIEDKTEPSFKQIRFNQKIQQKQNYDLWARIGFSGDTEYSVEIILNNQRNNLFELEPSYSNQYKWFKLTSLNLNEGSHDFALNFLGPNITLDQIVLIPSQVYNQKKENLNNYLTDKETLFIKSSRSIEFATDVNKFLKKFYQSLAKKKNQAQNQPVNKPENKISEQPEKQTESNQESQTNIYQIDKINEIGYWQENQKIPILNIIDEGADIETWQSAGYLKIKTDPEDETNKYLTLEKSSLLEKKLNKIDLSAYSQLIFRLKESFIVNIYTENIIIFFEDVNKQKCKYDFKTSPTWQVYKFNFSECQADQADLDWSQITKIGISGIYGDYRIYLDYFYLVNDQEFAKINKIKDLWVIDNQGNEYQYNLFDILTDENIIPIDFDGNYQFILQLDPEAQAQTFGQIKINQLILPYQRKNNQLITDSIFLKQGVYQLNLSGQLSALAIKIIYFANKPETKLKGENLFKIENKALDIISWQMINPSKYIVKAKVYQPGFINLLDSYDQGWLAEYNNKTTKSIQLTTLNNSFYIEPTTKGQIIDIYLKYEPQKYVNLGFIIFLGGWIFIISCLLILFFTKRKTTIIALIGPDGSGKSTYIKTIAQKLKQEKIDYKIHYPFNYFLLRKIIDLFKKKQTFKKSKQTSKQNNEKILYKFWPLIAIADNWLNYLFLRSQKNKIILADRYYYDLATSFLEFGYTFNWLYKLYLILIPTPDICFIFEAQPKLMQKRETKDKHELNFYFRQRKRYLKIGQKFSFYIINTDKNKSACQKEILTILKKHQVIKE